MVPHGSSDWFVVVDHSILYPTDSSTPSSPSALGDELRRLVDSSCRLLRDPRCQSRFLARVLLRPYPKTPKSVCTVYLAENQNQVRILTNLKHDCLITTPKSQVQLLLKIAANWLSQVFKFHTDCFQVQTPFLGSPSDCFKVQTPFLLTASWVQTPPPLRLFEPLLGFRHPST